MTPTETGTRPRVEGERELEILEATLEVLDEVGYDLLTMDAVATRAKASKATLYRRWKGKPELVVAAIMAHKGEPVVPDTGTLRGDLLEAYCGGTAASTTRSRSRCCPPSSPRWAATRSSPRSTGATSSAPRSTSSRAIYERARERGEVHPDVDLSVLAPALAGIVLHRGVPARRHRHPRARRPGARRGHPPGRPPRPLPRSTPTLRPTVGPL